MPSVIAFALPVLAIAGLVALTVSVAFLAGLMVVRTIRRRPSRRVGENERRPCRYCFFGRAVLTEERAQVEEDELVEVTCYVCRSCGLPQWTVERSPVLKRAL
jgi:hypothetical protein